MFDFCHFPCRRPDTGLLNFEAMGGAAQEVQGISLLFRKVGHPESRLEWSLNLGQLLGFHKEQFENLA